MEQKIKFLLECSDKRLLRDLKKSVQEEVNNIIKPLQANKNSDLGVGTGTGCPGEDFIVRELANNILYNVVYDVLKVTIIKFYNRIKVKNRFKIFILKVFRRKTEDFLKITYPKINNKEVVFTILVKELSQKQIGKILDEMNQIYKNLEKFVVNTKKIVNNEKYEMTLDEDNKWVLK
jgi:hypothetical protein